MGKGAFSYGAGKCMSSKSSGMSGTGKMSSAHGTNGQSKNNNMNQNTGGDRIGSNCRTFKHEAYPVAGPAKPYPKHAGQPGGHKSKA